MTDGLKDAHREAIIAVIAANDHVERAVLFGSRATGTNTVSSDVDIALFGNRLTLTDQSRLSAALDEIPMAQSVDLLLYDSIRDRTLLEHILTHGVHWYTRATPLRRVPLRNLCDAIVDCPHSTPAWTPDGVVVLRSKNIRDGRLDLSQPSYTSEQDYGQRTKRATPRAGDLVITREAPMGEVCMIPEGLRCCLGQRMVLLRPCLAATDPRYLLYALQSEPVQHEIRSHDGTGSTVSNLRISLLADLGIPSHPLSEQRVIANILGTLDDKIELNRRMNATLEAMARALFRSWFVDFDPVRAKMEGRDTGLPKEVADLFPDRLVDSELGEIPTGWIVRTLGDLCCKPQYGYTASGRSEPVGPRFLRITDINKEAWVSWSRVPYCEATQDEFSKYRLAKGDLLIARMADPGHGILVEEDVKAVFASYLIRFRPVEDRNARLLQYWLKSGAYWQLVRGQAAGTTRVSLNARVLSLFPLVVPPDGVANAFGTVVGALRERLVQSAAEMQLLAELRDTLLPRLVSGELRVTGPEPLSAHDDRPVPVATHEA